MVKTVKKTKKKLNIKRLILLLLILYLIVIFFYTILNLPLHNIYIKNTNLLTDNEIIEAAGIKNYPNIFKIKSKKVAEKIKKLDLVTDVKVEKKLSNKLVITITEAKPLFYNRTNEKIVLSNKKEVELNKKYLGIPTLVNSIPTDIYNNFIESFTNISSDIIGMINEIEYNPDISKDIVIDSNRFLLRMNDTNIVYVNTLNMKRLNDYKRILETIGKSRGTLYLDSYNSNNSLFTKFEDITDNTEENIEESDQNE